MWQVWPSESLLLYLFLYNPKIHEYLGAYDKCVLELGGGMTSLCGLGLSINRLCAHMVLTDGHPDCIRNQVSACLICLCAYMPDGVDERRHLVTSMTY